jgi:hypothetical protein
MQHGELQADRSVDGTNRDHAALQAAVSIEYSNISEALKVTYTTHEHT